MSSSSLEHLKMLTEKLHKKDKKLEENENLLKILLDSAPDAMVVVNASRKIVMVNKQTEKLFGYERQELIGKDVEILIPPNLKELYITSFAKYVEAPTFQITSLFGRNNDGLEISLEISLNPLVLSNGLLITSSIRDLSKCKRHNA